MSPNTSAAEGENRTAFRGAVLREMLPSPCLSRWSLRSLATQPTLESARRHNVFTDWRRESRTCHGDDLEVWEGYAYTSEPEHFRLLDSSIKSDPLSMTFKSILAVLTETVSPSKRLSNMSTRSRYRYLLLKHSHGSLLQGKLNTNWG